MAQTRVRRAQPESAAPLEPSKVIAERVAAIRRYLGWTQQELAERMQEVGIDWERVTVAKFESGRRGFVRVDELLGLCVALEISVADLLVPADVDPERPYRIIPNATARAVDVREFVRGESPLYLFPYPEPETEQDPDVPWASPIGGTSVDPTQWMPGDRAARVAGRYQDIEEEEDEDR